MYKKGIYPIPEITQKGKKLLFYKKLEETYKLSFNSFKDDWADQEIPTNRFDCPENIRLAITLLGTFNDPKIKDAIQLAKQELKQAELKKQ
jgi:hypothetical protein